MPRTPERADLLDAMLHDRRSVRGFHPEPVPMPVLERVFTMAQQAPSNCNVQPWATEIVSGAAAERMRTALHQAALLAQAPSPDIPLTAPFPGLYRTRQVNAAKALFAATGIARDDMAARQRSFLRNFRFFDAPHAAFFFLPGWAGMREAADCGMYAQSLMLALTVHGLGSCAQGALSHHAAVVRAQLGIPTDMMLLFGLAFGYADDTDPSNATITDRAPLHEAVRFHA